MKTKLVKPNWFDWWVYGLFFKRWGKILACRPDLREYMISWMKAYDVIDEGESVKITVTIEKNED